MSPQAKLMWILLAPALVSFLAGCEKFQQETYKMSAYDQKACGILQSEQTDTLRPPAVSAFDSTWTPNNVVQHAAQLLDSLQARGITISEGEKNYVVIPPAGADTSYLRLTISSKPVTVFLSDVVDIALVDAEGNIKHAEKASIPFEVAAECPDILGRFTFSVEPGTYLLLFGMNDRTLGKPVHVAVLGGQ